MKNAWTGGQYSLIRTVFGLFVACHLTQVLFLGPNSSGVAKFWLSAASLGCCIPFIIGWKDRYFAVFLIMLSTNPWVEPDWSDRVIVPCALLIHLFLPKAPYGSIEARDRTDPGGNWVYGDKWLNAAWLFCSLAYLGWGLQVVLRAETTTPIDEAIVGGAVLLMGLSAFSAKIRPYSWCLLWLPLALSSLTKLNLHAGEIWILQLFLFEPRWIPGLVRKQVDTIFYDGDCGVCHASVRFLLSEDPDGSRFVFAPLQSDLYAQTLNEEQRAQLPETMVLVEPDGHYHARFKGIRLVLRRLGGLWRILGELLRIVPAPLGDLGYKVFARVRHSIFAKPEDSCPIISQELRKRFVSL